MNKKHEIIRNQLKLLLTHLANETEDPMNDLSVILDEVLIEMELDLRKEFKRRRYIDFKMLPNLVT